MTLGHVCAPTIYMYMYIYIYMYRYRYRYRYMYMYIHMHMHMHIHMHMHMHVHMHMHIHIHIYIYIYIYTYDATAATSGMSWPHLGSLRFWRCELRLLPLKPKHFQKAHDYVSFLELGVHHRTVYTCPWCLKLRAGSWKRRPWPLALASSSS